MILFVLEMCMAAYSLENNNNVILLTILLLFRFSAAGILSTCRVEGNSLMGWSATIDGRLTRVDNAPRLSNKKRYKNTSGKLNLSGWLLMSTIILSGCAFHQSRERQQESENLLDPQQQDWLQANNFELLGWKSITPERKHLGTHFSVSSSS